MQSNVHATRQPPVPGPGTRERNVLLGAFVVSVLLHVVGAAVTWRLPLVPRADLQARRAPADEVELLLVPDEEAAAAQEDALPKAYTSVPERDASETPPEKPDYLALHHSLAADNKLGDGDRPSAETADEFEQVAIQREDLSGAGGVAYAPTPVYRDNKAAGGAQAQAQAQKQDARDGEDRGALGEMALSGERQEARDGADDGQPDADESKPAELAEWWAGQAPSVLREGDEGAVGDRGFDFDQDARGTITSGVAVVDDMRLNTYEWDFAPWIQRFANELQRNWNPPYAYKLGLLSGKTRLHVVVAPSGRLATLEIVETEGHQSLHEASQAALKAFAPYAPLPPDFPEENLEIDLTLIYPGPRR